MRFARCSVRGFLTCVAHVPHKSPTLRCHLDRSLIKQGKAGLATSSGLRQKATGALVALKITAYLLAGTIFIIYLSDSRALIYSHVLTPLLHALLDPEQAHKLAILALRLNLTPRERFKDPPELKTEIFGKTVCNPVWLSAGFDKNGEVIDPLLDIGFGAVEIGSVTPESQPGNPPPRVFRLSKDKAIINRYGFNSLGASFTLLELRKRALDHATEPGTGTLSLVDGKLLGINIGRNKESPCDSIDDYIRGIEMFVPYADYLVLNVSSPNTPGLTKMQKKDNLEFLLSSAIKTRNQIAREINRVTPLCIKLSPDLSNNELKELLDVLVHNKIDGIIVANTTASRPCGLLSGDDLICEIGGFSGPPIMPRALEMVKKVRQYTNGSLPIIASGGISSADDALKFAQAGASAVQIYTHFIYEGPGAATKIKCDLVKKLKEDNTTWADVVASGMK